jgi:leucyl-tRNA synthetase
MSTAKRDTVRRIEIAMQERWREQKAFEQNAPTDPEKFAAKEKFMATFPYPYMNGKLHLGHAFTVSKAEFAVGFEAMKGKQAIWPFGFHCTGMPIKAAADKLRGEMDKFGNPPVFPVDEAAAEGNLGGKHAKVAAKTGKAKYQWEIMQQNGIPDGEIEKFSDPRFWMDYFPPIAQKDLFDMGCRIDWRRSFITTDVNPFYDSFVRWQFNKLKAQGRILFGKRHTIYSPLDGQPCMDHDRASGENVGPKEYTVIKLRVVEFPADREVFAPLAAYKNVYLGAATLRPETMIGQTNCWVGPEITYGAYELADEGNLIVCTQRAARNMAFQELLKHSNVEPVPIAQMVGSDLIGLQVAAPMAPVASVPVLPMFAVSADMGTGIVTSVPSNAPADYVALRDLQEKEPLRRKFNLDDAVIAALAPVAIIRSPTFGDYSAVTVSNEMDIKSQNDSVKLELAKEKVYKDDFYESRMLAGPQTGELVSKAKVVMRDYMIGNNDAFIYFEPEKAVISRSGDACVVALTDQWYLDYGEETWRAQAEKCLAQMEVFSPDVYNSFVSTLDWMKQWACSRSFGLGSRLPWDPVYLIESLSDSTIYMAYYTVAHILQEGALDGSIRPHNIDPAQMSDNVWDWVFGENDEASALDAVSSESGIPIALLEKMRREFRFWYPFDLRVSGKDLVPNHLTFSIYNHVAIFPERFWPKGIRANGHLLLNSEKMSKSTGNFMSLREGIEEYGADATRLAFADAGDGIEDANFVKDTANKAILRLFNQVEFYQEMMKSKDLFRQESDGLVWADEVMLAEINRAIESTFAAYQATNYREALKCGFYELQNARDRYRDVTVLHGTVGMSWPIVYRFMKVQALLLLPLAPHFSEYVWTDIMGESKTIREELFPTAGPVDESLIAGSLFMQKLSHSLHIALENELNPKKGKKGPAVAVEPPNSIEIYVAVAYPRWQEQAIEILRTHYNHETKSFVGDDVIAKALKELMKEKPNKKLVPFAMELKQRAAAVGIAALDRRLLFDELAVLSSNVDFVSRTLGGLQVVITPVDPSQVEGDAKKEASLPGEPSYRFYKQ